MKVAPDVSFVGLILAREALVVSMGVEGLCVRGMYDTISGNKENRRLWEYHHGAYSLTLGSHLGHRLGRSRGSQAEERGGERGGGLVDVHGFSWLGCWWLVPVDGWGAVD